MKPFILTLALLATALPALAQVEKFGSDHGRPPNAWTKFEWPEMRKILFGQFMPTAEELALIDKAVPKKATAKPAKARKILVFYRCLYPHTSISTGCAAIEKIAESTAAFTVDLSDDPTDFSAENLRKYDAVLLVNTVGYEKILGEEACQRLLQFVKSGKGLIGIHAASDACKGWPEGAAMMGGIFQCHPWLPKGTWAFQLETPDHPVNAAFDGKGFWLRDEIYYYRGGSFSRDRSRVLVGLDMHNDHNCNSKELHQGNKKLAVKGAGQPVSWVHEFGKGRVFYSNFGHNNSTYWQPEILQHYLDGIQFALGDLKADATPSAKANAKIAPAPER